MACGTEGCCPDTGAPETFLIGARILAAVYLTLFIVAWIGYTLATPHNTP